MAIRVRASPSSRNPADIPPIRPAHSTPKSARSNAWVQDVSRFLGFTAGVCVHRSRASVSVIVQVSLVRTPRVFDTADHDLGRAQRSLDSHVAAYRLEVAGVAREDVPLGTPPLVLVDVDDRRSLSARYSHRPTGVAERAAGGHPARRRGERRAGGRPQASSSSPPVVLDAVPAAPARRSPLRQAAIPGAPGRCPPRRDVPYSPENSRPAALRRVGLTT